MDGWVKIGELAKQLGTSRAKAGQMASVLKCEKVRKNTGATTHIYIRQADADMLKAKMGTFTAILGRGASQKPVKPKRVTKKERENDHANFERLFVNPIMVQDFRTGVTRGQGLEAYLKKEMWG